MNELKTKFSHKLQRLWDTLLYIFGPKKVAVLCVVTMTVMMLALTISVRSCSGAGDSDQNADPVITERNTLTSKVTGKQLPKTASALKKEADRIAASYDYDKALALVAEYESAYENAEDCSAYKQELQTQKAQCARWEDTTHIPHIFFHSLIADTDRAFDGDEDEEEHVKPAKLVKLPNLVDYMLSKNMPKAMKIQIATMLIGTYNKFKDSKEDRKIVVQCLTKVMRDLQNNK